VVVDLVTNFSHLIDIVGGIVGSSKIREIDPTVSPHPG
jgi:hypothetical protein